MTLPESARLDAVVSGGGSGIGKAIALELGRRGHRLLLLGRTADALEATLAAAGGAGRTAEVDVRDPAAVRDALAASAAAGVRPGIVVPAAGVARVAALEDLADADLRESIETNLLGALHLFRVALPEVRRARGHLFALLSAAALRGFPGWSGYCASKWGLRGALEALREELRGSGVRLTAIYPGATATPLWQAVPGEWDRAAMIPAEEVARAVGFALDSKAAVHEIHLQPIGGDL